MSIRQDFQYQVNVLGPISVEGPDGLVDPGGNKPRLLLSLLVANAGEMVSTERLIDRLWGDDPPATARKTVHVHVSNLRRSLGAGFPLQTTRAGYRLDRDQLTIDAVRFESGLARGAARLEASPAEAADMLAAALQLWTGPAYADVADEDAIRPEALRLTELRLSAIEYRIEADLRVGRHAALLGELETLTIDNPFRERLRELQMLALYRCGRQADALRTYERTRRTLSEELGLDPGPALRQQYQKILDQSHELDLVTEGSGPSTLVGRHVGSPGRTIRGYELRERLGGRGDGGVYRAYQAALGREVALRIIPPADANQPEFVKGFEASCQLLADLSHPHIVAMHDYWREPDGAYVAMPLIRGFTLERSIERSLWRPPAALRLLEQVGSALTYAHRRSVMHGDVRPSNVLLDEDGNGYLSDFVIDGRGVTPMNETEQALGVAADVEGLALITSVMLTGTGPQDAPFTHVQLPAGFGDLMRMATNPNPMRRFERVEDYLRALRQCFGVDSVSTLETRVTSETRNPFKGLRAFREADASDFFGRDDLVQELLERVSSNGLTAVVGPSGSGKSSLVKAGLVPACRARGLTPGRDLVIAEMLPGRYPFEQLEAALIGVAVDRPARLLADLSADDEGLLRAAKRILPDDDTDLLLIIDQFEELFALTADEYVRQAFVANLCSVARDDRHRVRVVVTLRADFFDRPLMYPNFGEIIKDSLTTVALPGESSLAEAIAQPARRVGLEIEPGLIPTILRDIANQPGSLPMLQYALTELFEARDGNLLTIDGYRRTGGVVGALAARAEEIFESLPPAGRDVAREVFVRLVSVGDESDDTRRRVRRTELEALGVDSVTLETVINAFGSFRLLTFDHDPVTRGPTVEVAHEALIREWPRYRGWIDELRDDLRAERRLASATSEWLIGDRDASFLVGGVQLERYAPWIDSPPVRLTTDERTFIEASRDDDRQRQSRTASRRRRVLIGATVLSVVAVIAAALALVQRDRADQQARAANEAAATAERLQAEAERSARRDRIEAAVAGATAQVDPDLGILLALAAHDQLQADGLSAPAVTSALYQATFDQRIVARVPAEIEPNDVFHAIAVAASSNGTSFATGRIRGNTVAIVDAGTGVSTSTFDSAQSRVVATTWNGDDGPVMTGRYDGVIDLWEPSGKQLESVTVSSLPVWPLLLRDGLLAFEELPSTNFTDAKFESGGLGNFTLVVHDQATGGEAFRSSNLVSKAVVSPSGNEMAVIENGELHIYDTASWEDVTPVRLRNTLESSPPLDIAWAPTANELWTLNPARIRRFDVDSGDEVKAFDTAFPSLNFVAPSTDGGLLALGGYQTPIHVIDATTGDLVSELVAANRDGSKPTHYRFGVVWAGQRRLIVAQDDSTLIWDLAEPAAAASFWPTQTIVPVAASFTAAGDRVLIADRAAVQVFDPSGHLRLSRDASAVPDSTALLSGDGAVLAVTDQDVVQFVDLASGAVRAVGPPGLTEPLGLSNDGRLAVLGNPSRHRVAIVDATTGDQLVNLGGRIEGAGAVFTSDGRVAVIPTSNFVVSAEPLHSTLRLVDVATGVTVATNYILDCVQGVALSHDDTTIAELGCDGSVALLDLTAAGRGPWTRAEALIGEVADDRTPIVGVAFTPDDDILIVARQDGRVEAREAGADLTRLWSFDVGENVGAPVVHEGMVWVGATRELETGSLSGGMVGMPLDPEALVSLARARATREMTTAECAQFVVEVTC